MNQCIKQNNEETTESKPVEFKIPDVLLKELEHYSAKDLIDAIIHMKNNKAGNPDASYGFYINSQSTGNESNKMRAYEEEQKAIAHEYDTLNQMFVCATRYLHRQKTDDEMAMETYKKLFDDFRQFYDSYNNRLDEYSKERFGMWTHELHHKLLKEEIRAGKEYEKSCEDLKLLP